MANAHARLCYHLDTTVSDKAHPHTLNQEEWAVVYGCTGQCLSGGLKVSLAWGDTRKLARTIEEKGNEQHLRLWCPCKGLPGDHSCSRVKCIIRLLINSTVGARKVLRDRECSMHGYHCSRSVVSRFPDIELSVSQPRSVGRRWLPLKPYVVEVRR